MLVDLGCRYVEIGHSERRRDHGETDPIVAAKVGAALRWDLVPVVCVGERTPGPADAARAVVTAQLEGGFRELAGADLDRVVVAYEPVWAIGEGAAAAEPDHVAALHLAIDAWLRDHGATTRRVIYGGSVDEANAADLLATPGVAGPFARRAAPHPHPLAAIAAKPLRRAPPGDAAIRN